MFTFESRREEWQVETNYLKVAEDLAWNAPAAADPETASLARKAGARRTKIKGVWSVDDYGVTWEVHFDKKIPKGKPRYILFFNGKKRGTFRNVYDAKMKGQALASSLILKALKKAAGVVKSKEKMSDADRATIDFFKRQGM